MLLDLWNPDPRVQKFLPTTTKRFSLARPRARRFVFSDEVVETYGRLLRDHPELLFRNYQFALPPYDTTYLEFNIKVFLTALGYWDDSSERPDFKIGYLLDRGLLMVLADDGYLGPEVSPIVYTINFGLAPPGYALVAVDNEHNRFGAMAFHMFGTTWANYPEEKRREVEADLPSRYHTWIEQLVSSMVPRDKLTELLKATVGDVRNAVAMLLWLAQPKILNIVDVPASRGWYRGKPRAYAAHHVVTLKKHINRRVIMRSFAERSSPRRHEVEAFWRNFNKQPHCEHDWPLYPSEDGHFKCARCGQWRVRVKSHERGDAGRGFVTKEYRAE
jgi:hypothetical protein